jgi:hypothetical protein
MKDDTEIAEDDLYAMSNLHPDDTGLPMTVWVRPRSNERHGPRIKVCTVPGPRMLPHDTVTVTLQPRRVIPPGGLSPGDLRAVNAWIDLNDAAIRSHWEGQISSAELIRRLQKLP